MELRDCERCMVYGTDSRPLSEARVVLGGGGILLYFRTFMLHSARVRTFVDFYDSQLGLVRCVCGVSIRKNPQGARTGEPWMADCAIMEVSRVIQRQKDLRVKVGFPVSCTTREGLCFSGTVRNISAGGFFLDSPSGLKTGTEFSFCHRLWGKEYELKARVRWLRADADGYGYGCQFYGIAPETERAVRRFVYRKQLEKRRKKKGA